MRLYHPVQTAKACATRVPPYLLRDEVSVSHHVEVHTLLENS